MKMMEYDLCTPRKRLSKMLGESFNTERNSVEGSKISEMANIFREHALFESLVHAAEPIDVCTAYTKVG